MDYIEADKKTCFGEFTADAHNLRFSIESLKSELNKLKPLMKECELKKINVEKEFPEVYQEWKELHRAVNEGEKRLLNMGANQLKLKI